jgi:chemotaxis protein CheY-P-specific phosphatase CheC
MVQRITKIGLKPDIGCFVLFDGGFSGLVVLNFAGNAALEIYEKYMLSMGMPKSELASSFSSDEVSNILGELMNQIVGDFTGKIRRELQTNITQNQPKMLVLNKQVMLSVDTPLDRPEIRRVSFFTENNNIFISNSRLIARNSLNCMILIPAKSSIRMPCWIWNKPI